MHEADASNEYQQFESLTAPEIDALEDAAYQRVFNAQSPEEARAAQDDIRLIGRFIVRRAIDG